MTTYQKAIAGVLAVIGLALLVAMFTTPSKAPTLVPKTAVGSPFTEQLCDSNNNSDATTTLEYLGSSAASSTPLDCYAANAESIDLNLLVNASTTASCVQWYNEFSPNNVDWYTETGTNIASNVSAQHGASGLLHTWCPGVSGDSYKNITITPTAEKYIRMVIKATGADSSIYAQYIMKAVVQ